jgi:hypothetical protein
MSTNVRSYTAAQLLSRVAELDGFKGFPEGYWFIGVRSQEDSFNRFDDPLYVFLGNLFVVVVPFTTNAGSKGLKEFHTYNKEGVAVLKSDTIIYDFWKRGLHRGKVMAYRQDKVFPYYRDNNYNEKNEEIGEVHNNIIYANFHPSSYITGQDIDKEYINGWSLACQVTANRKDFDTIMALTTEQKHITYALLQEFTPVLLP